MPPAPHQLLEQAARLSTKTGTSLKNAALAAAAVHGMWQVATAAEHYTRADADTAPAAYKQLQTAVEEWNTNTTIIGDDDPPPRNYNPTLHYQPDEPDL